MGGTLVAQRAVAEHELANTNLWLQRSCDPDDHESGDSECGVLLDRNPCERCARTFQDGHTHVRSNAVDVGLPVQCPRELPPEILPPATTKNKNQAFGRTRHRGSSELGPVSMELLGGEERPFEMFAPVLGDGHIEP